MATHVDINASFKESPSSWSTEKLRAFMREKNLPLGGSKAELIVKASEYMETEALEKELGVTAFKELCVRPTVNFEDVPKSGWSKERLPKIEKWLVSDYLKKQGSYTKNYRTGVRLCQCGHVYDIECVFESQIFVKAKCRPTMRRNPPFYTLFAVFSANVTGEYHIEGGNCMCPAGNSQSCVHMAALLLNLAEITQTACTSLPCAWSRPSIGGKAMLAAELHFGQASIEGYTEYTGVTLDVNDLLESLEQEDVVTGIGLYISQEQEKQSTVKSLTVSDEMAAKVVLTDPLDKLKKPIEDLTVDDLREALQLTTEEISLLQTMTTGQRENPLWMDVRQWRVTASNFGRICNRKREPGFYPTSLTKLLLGDYGHPASPSLQWGIDHEDEAIALYHKMTGVEVHPCGIFVGIDSGFLGASPDGVVFNQEAEMGIIEVKCPYKHRMESISNACEDKYFHLEVTNGKTHLKRTHDYFFQITGQLAITEASFCDCVTWTCKDIFVERIYLDANHWGKMLLQLQEFYTTSLGPEII